MSNVTDEQRAKSQAHEKAQFKIWAESKFEHIAEHMRWVTISIAEEGWMARAALAAQEGGAVQWACERWRAEVANRPLVNTHRRALDTTWRQVVRHFGGDDVALLGPCHDDLVSAQEGGWER